MADKENENVKQHITPQFYIKYYYDDSGRGTFVLVRPDFGIEFRTSGSQAFEPDAFSTFRGGGRSTAGDDANQLVERMCPPYLKKINPGSDPDVNDWGAMRFFAANMLCRSCWARDAYRNLYAPVMKDLPRLQETLRGIGTLPGPLASMGSTPEMIDELPQVLQDAREAMYPATARDGTVPTMEDLQQHKKCDLLIAPSERRFITSDDPALILKDGKPITMKLAPGFIAAPSLEVYLALNPRVAMLWSARSSYSKVPVDVADVDRWNGLVWHERYERVFSSRRDELERFLP